MSADAFQPIGCHGRYHDEREDHDAHEEIMGYVLFAILVSFAVIAMIPST
jgi:hypothetical protein